jgi:hypothetical protein
MKGWKTWAGAALVAASAILGFMGKPDAAKALMALGAAFGLVGLGHKIEKSSRM